VRKIPDKRSSGIEGLLGASVPLVVGKKEEESRLYGDLCSDLLAVRARDRERERERETEGQREK